MREFQVIKNCDLTNKNVIVRVDINVPIVNNKIEDDTRIKAIIPTLKYLTEKKSKVILISHFGRPEGKFDASMSLKQVLPRIQELMSPVKVSFVEDCIGEKVKNAVNSTNFGAIILLENLRFYKQETKNDPEFSRELASLASIYINDAFSCSHRAHASITGIPAILKSETYAGFLMESELKNLENLLERPQEPIIAVVGGSKISTKIDLLNSLVRKSKTIFVGGGMANSFLFAKGKNIGKSLCEKDLKDKALEIMENAKKYNCEIILPKDVVVVKKFEANSPHKTVLCDHVGEDEIIVDVGSATVDEITKILKNHKTLIWNGPLGAFEIKPFNEGTEGFAKEVAKLTKEKKLLSVAGGGDVVSALNSCNLANDFTYISTAGGAFLEWLEGKELPGIKALKRL